MARMKKSQFDSLEPTEDAVKSDPVPDVDDLDADTPPAPTEPPKGPLVIFQVLAPSEAVAELLAAFPDAKEILITSCGKHSVVAQIDFIPKKIVYKTGDA